MKFKDPIEVVDDIINIRHKIENIVTSTKPELSFRVCCVDDIIDKYKNWVSLLPRVTPYYAVKCNDHPVVLKVLAALGTGFDCASKSEIRKILLLRVKPDRIIYANTIKTLHYIRYAAKVNVNLMTFDNELELHKIKYTFPEARMVIRISCDAKAVSNFGLKFGCDPKKEARKLLQTARSLNLQVVGVSFHVGLHCSNPHGYFEAIRESRRVFDIASSLGYNFELLDIGGGYPGKTGSSLQKYAEAINAGLVKYFPDDSIRVISEPGSYFVDSAFTLACNIVSAKNITVNSSLKMMYYINDGVFNNLGMVVHAKQIKIPQPLKNDPNAKSYSSVVWGQSLNSEDLVVQDVMLPEMQLGDWIYFIDVGAYAAQLQTPFNAFEKSRCFFFVSRNNWSSLSKRDPFIKADFIEKVLAADTTNRTGISDMPAKE